MKYNRSRLIKLILAFLLVFTLLVLKNELPKYLSKKQNLAFTNIKKVDIKEVKITKDKTVRIYKKDVNWFVNSNGIEIKADKERLNKMIDNIINLKKGEPVSANKKKHNELGIDKQKIELISNNNTYVLYVGDTNGLSSNYVRINDDNEVFIADGLEDIFINNDYRDLSLHLIADEAKVTEIVIKYNGVTSLLLTKENNSWKSDDKKANNDRVNFYINDLKTLKAKDILRKKETYQTVSPELSVSIKEDSKEKLISFYPETEATYLAINNAVDYDYTIAAAYVASLKKEEKDFLE